VREDLVPGEVSQQAVPVPFEAGPALDALPVGITVQDRNGNLVYANAAGAILLGYPSGPVVTRTEPSKIVARFEFVTEEGDPVPIDSLPGRRALRGEEPGELVMRVRNVESGEESWRAVTAIPIRDERGNVGFAVNVFRDITAEKRAHLRLTAKDTVTRILAESATLEEATPRIMEAISRAFQWDLGQMWRVDETENLLRFVEGWRAPGVDVEGFVRLSRQTTFQLGVGLPGRVWASGEAAWIVDVQEDENFPRAPVAAEVGLHGAFGFPVLQRGKLLGVMEFLSRGIRAPDRDILQLMGNLGIQIGAYIERRQADEDRRFLIGVGDALSESMGWEETLERVTRLAVPRIADSCVVYIRDEETAKIARVALEDRSVEGLAESLQKYTLQPEAAEGVPKVIRTGRPELHPEADPALLAADVDDPAGLAAELETMAPRSWMCVPLTARGRTFGAVSFVTSVSHRRLEEHDLALAMDLARRAAVEVDNAALFRAEQAAQYRLAFLAEASRILSGSLDYKRTLQRLAQVAVPQLADWCGIDMLEDDGSIRQVAMAHVDSEKIEMAREFRRRYPPHPDAPTGLPNVLRTGKPEHYPEVTDETLIQAAQDEDQLRLLRELGLRSVMIVPLTARGRTLGALTMVAAESGRRYGERDLIFAVDLARRAGVAVDNARLYRQRAHVARTLQRSLLPPELPAIPGVQLAARYRPAGEGIDIGGDFYDVLPLANGEWAVLIGDVCGKGVEAAAVTGLARYGLRTILHNGQTAADALEALNDEMRISAEASTFCTVAYAQLIPDGGSFTATVVCAGHPTPLVLRSSGLVERAGEPGTLVGVLEDLELHPRSVPMGPGDTLFMYTDGLVEGLAGDEAAEALLRGFLADCSGQEAEAIADSLDRALGDAAVRPRDDSAFLVVRVEPAGKA
jgi:PAS domain S-box-containing protein